MRVSHYLPLANHHGLRFILLGQVSHNSSERDIAVPVTSRANRPSRRSTQISSKKSNQIVQQTEEGNNNFSRSTNLIEKVTEKEDDNDSISSSQSRQSITDTVFIELVSLISSYSSFF